MVVRIHRGQLMRFFRLLAVAGILAIPAAATAQQSGNHARATVLGVAVDSVRGGYLRGAIVSVSGTTLSAITDSMGRFRIDSVPAGNRYLELMHPLLDTLRLVVRSPERQIPAGGSMSFILSVPSARTVVATKCTVEDLARGQAALIGMVQDADTENPSPGASVVVEWTDYQLSSKKVARMPQRRVGAVRPDGTYRVCGIPSDLTTGAVAYRGADSTSAVAINFANGLGVMSFHIPVAQTIVSTVPDLTPAAGAARVTRPRGKAVLSGKIVDGGGTPLASARVALEADDAATTTDNKGQFTLGGLRSGTRSLSVRRLGFEPMEVPVDLSSVTPREVTVTMSRFVPVLEAVRVSAVRLLGLQRVGFTDRRTSGNGKFYGPEDIATRNPQTLNALLETAPSLRMGTDAEGHRYVTGRLNGCVKYYVDGHAWFAGSNNDPQLSPDGFLSGGELAGIEIYDELSVPSEFTNSSSHGANCAVVVIWTKQKLGY